jgi:peptidoglycan/LPS O-acetylase OafA/YrhL
MSTATRIHWADLARGLAALGVVAYHVDVPGTSEFYVFVDFFFILSGFVLSKSIGKINSGADWAHFMLKRLFRFMPLVWMAVAAKVALTLIGTMIGKPCGAHECQPVLVISAALLLQIFIPATFMVLGPLWSLSVELYANAVYAFKFRLSRKTLTFIGVSIGLFLTITSYFVPRYGAEMFDNYHGFARGMLAFGLGLSIRYLPEVRNAWMIIGPSLIGSLLVLTVNFYHFQALFASVIFTALIWGFASLEFESTNELYVKIATVLGNASFGIYVWHGAIRGTIMKVASVVGIESGTTSYWLFNLLVLALVSTLLSLFTFHFVEQPVMRWFSAQKFVWLNR